MGHDLHDRRNLVRSAITLKLGNYLGEGKSRERRMATSGALFLCATYAQGGTGGSPVLGKLFGSRTATNKLNA